MLIVPCDCQDCHSPAVTERVYALEGEYDLSLADRNEWYTEEYDRLNELVPDHLVTDPKGLLDSASGLLMEAMGVAASTVYLAGRLSSDRKLPAPEDIETLRAEIDDLQDTLDGVDIVLRHAKPLVKHAAVDGVKTPDESPKADS